MSGFSIANAVKMLKDTPTAPCDMNGGCPNRARCSAELLSCYAFGVFVVTGRSPERGPGDEPKGEFYAFHEQELRPLLNGESIAPRRTEIRISTLRAQLAHDKKREVQSLVAMKDRIQKGRP